MVRHPSLRAASKKVVSSRHAPFRVYINVVYYIIVAMSPNQGGGITCRKDCKVPPKLCYVICFTIKIVFVKLALAQGAGNI
jgi:hypothetical protein